jgi:hypothetical protein
MAEANISQMSNEQLQQLIQAMLASARINAGADEKVKKSKGSFSTCSSRFGGQRHHEAVEEFITSVETFKDIEEISDEDALKGISLLFYGIASTWWQGVRKEAKTWKDAIDLIREHFSPTKPAYQIYMEIFAEQQDSSTAIDTFVCEKRALLAQLPDGRHDVQTELDLIYGLLNIKYRRHIARHDVNTFKDLLEKGRIIEHNNLEVIEDSSKGPVRGSKGSKRCTYCNYRGHTTDQCRKRKSANDKRDNNSNAGGEE